MLSLILIAGLAVGTTWLWSKRIQPRDPRAALAELSVLGTPIPGAKLVASSGPYGMPDCPTEVCVTVARTFAASASPMQLETWAAIHNLAGPGLPPTCSPASCSLSWTAPGNPDLTVVAFMSINDQRLRIEVSDINYERD